MARRWRDALFFLSSVKHSKETSLYASRSVNRADRLDYKFQGFEVRTNQFHFSQRNIDELNYCIEQGWPNFLDRGLFSEIWTKSRATPHYSILSLSCRYVLWCFKKALRLTYEQGRCAPWNLLAQRIKIQRKWQLWRWCMMYVGLFWVVSGGLQREQFTFISC